LKPLISQFFEQGKEKNLNQLAKKYSIFTPKKLPLALQNMGWGPGIRKNLTPDPGIKKATDYGYGYATLPTSILIFSGILTVIS
jgi:hypothetical protein